MKKTKVILLSILIISCFVIVASEDTPPNISESISNTNLADIGKSANLETENIFEREVSLPDELKLLEYVIKFIAGGAENVTWSEFFFGLLLFILLFLLFSRLLDWTSFESNWVKVVIAAGLAFILAVLGGINALLNFLVTHLSLKGVLMTLLIFLFIITILNGVIKAIKKRNRMDKARERGVLAGTSIKGLSKITKSMLKIKN